MASRARLAIVVAALGLGAWGCGAGGQAGGAAGKGGATAGSGGATGGGGATAGSGVTAGSGGTTGGGGMATAGGAGGASTAGTGGGGSSGGGGGGAGVGDAGAPVDAALGTGTAPLTQLLRIIEVQTVQGTQKIVISIDRQKQAHAAPQAGQPLTMRIHVRPDTGWVPHATVCELHVVTATMDVILTSTRTITGASSEQDLQSTFNFDLTAAQVTKDLKFSAALRDPTGSEPDAPPAIQRALYPMDGTLDTLGAQ